MTLTPAQQKANDKLMDALKSGPPLRWCTPHELGTSRQTLAALCKMGIAVCKYKYTEASTTQSPRIEMVYRSTFGVEEVRP